MANKGKQRPSRAKKRKFNSNQFKSNQPSLTPTNKAVQNDVVAENNQEKQGDNSDAATSTQPQPEIITSASKKKLFAGMNELSKEHSDEEPNFNFIMDFSMLKKLVNLIGTCPECSCNSKLCVSDDIKNGLAHSFNLCCNNCAWSEVLETSSKVKVKKTLKEGKKKATGRNPYDVNLRSVIAFREIGGGLAAMEMFCTIMNMKPPMTVVAYTGIKSTVTDVFVKCAQQSMKTAAKEIPSIFDNTQDGGPKDVIASFDGTWQKRGYASTNGVVTGISGGKCVDYVVYSKNCHACKYWEKRQNLAGYAEWKGLHTCPVNHTGSAGSMESKGAVSMFQRSSFFNGLRYRSYLGDGDSSSFSDVVKADPYPGITINKLECVGHVQKRVGSRLRTMSTNMKGKKLSDGKGLTGKGRLTKKIMDSLQNFYGMSIRANVGKLYLMKKAIAGIIHHCAKNEDSKERHKYCPRDQETTWCKYYKLDESDRASYKPSINLPPAVVEVVKPVFSYADLGADSLLERCPHGETQNPNEALNQLIWKRCPKYSAAGRQIVEFSTAAAVLQFNDGGSGLVNVMKSLNMKVGYYSRKGIVKIMRKRVYFADKKSQESTKKRRKKLRSIKKGFEDKNLENEGEQYVSGGF